MVLLAELAQRFSMQRVGGKFVAFVRVGLHVVEFEAAIGIADQPQLIGTNAVISWMLNCDRHKRPHGIWVLYERETKEPDLQMESVESVLQWCFVDMD